MNVKITDIDGKKPSFVQWDVDRVLLISGVDSQPALHFANCDLKRAIVVLAEEDGDNWTCKVPNVILQHFCPMVVSVFVQPDEGKTVLTTAFQIKPKMKPQDYTYEENVGYTNWVQKTAEAQALLDAIEDLRAEIAEAAETADAARDQAVAAATNIDTTVAESLAAAKASGMFDGADGEDGADGAPGAPGAKGDDGVSPRITVTEITGGHNVAISDAYGDYSIDVMDGAAGAPGTPGAAGPTGPAGADGEDGEDGYSPTVTVTNITGGHRVTITDADGAHTFDVMDGQGGGTTVVARGEGTDSVISVSSTNPNTAAGGYAFAAGRSNDANGDNSVAMGYNSLASGLTSIAIGGTVSGKARNQATQAGAVAIGQSNQSSGYYSIAMGREAIASGTGAVALGYGNTASGNGSFAAGGQNVAGARCSTAIGLGTEASGGNSLVAGKYNEIDDAAQDATTGEREFALIIGNGTDDSNRSNAMTLDWDGNLEVSGGVTTAEGDVDTRINSKVTAPSSPATGAFLVWNGSAWVAQTLATWQGGNY